jgi:hypothetical protein
MRTIANTLFQFQPEAAGYRFNDVMRVYSSKFCSLLLYYYYCFMQKRQSVQSQNLPLTRMASSGMLGRVAFVRTDVSRERSASIIRVTRIGEAGKR